MLRYAINCIEYDLIIWFFLRMNELFISVNYMVILSSCNKKLLHEGIEILQKLFFHYSRFYLIFLEIFSSCVCNLYRVYIINFAKAAP